MLAHIIRMVEQAQGRSSDTATGRYDFEYIRAGSAGNRAC